MQILSMLFCLHRQFQLKRDHASGYVDRSNTKLDSVRNKQIPAPHNYANERNSFSAIDLLLQSRVTTYKILHTYIRTAQNENGKVVFILN